MNPGTAALTRGLDALALLADAGRAPDGLGVTQLAELLGSDKSQISRTLQTLAEHGFVGRDPETHAYRLGWRVFALAGRGGEARLLTEAPPLLRALVREVRESAHLSVRVGSEVLTLLSESPESAIHAPGKVGGLTPLATTSAGRVLAIDLGDAELGALGLADAAEAIGRARALGYAIVREEFEPGLVAAAAPVRDAAGRVIAAINVSAPRFRLDDERLEAAASLVVAAADALSARFRGP